jgi:hypothetical protein
MVAMRMLVLTIFVPAAMSSIIVIRTLRFPATSTNLFGYFGVGTLADGD